MGLSSSKLCSTWIEFFKRIVFALSDDIETVIARSISFGSREVEERPECHVAATKLQKVYKSYRTRRNLADCAIVVEELWWKTIDSADLERNSVSFFKLNGHESPALRWCRLQKKAAKVGKGMLKDEKAQKLALHHWLEAIDPRHRYGRNLHFYYDVWSDRKSFEPFFYWLDIGEGKAVNLATCDRVNLQRQCIHYLGPKEREGYEVVVAEGKLVYKQCGTFLDTDKRSKWIFVLSTSRKLYVGKKEKGVFQHSSFLSGGAASSAGRLVVHNGILKEIGPYSGHYLPTEDNFKEFISFLEEHNVDMTNVKRCSADDETPPLDSTYKDSKRETEDSHTENASITADNITLDEQVTNGNTVNADKPRPELSKSLSRKYSSRAGPRIGCVMEYDMELRSEALEKVNLSPSVSLSPRYSKACDPIPSPRPSPEIRVSPALKHTGAESLVTLQLPNFNQSPISSVQN